MLTGNLRALRGEKSALNDKTFPCFPYFPWWFIRSAGSVLPVQQRPSIIARLL